MQSTTTYVTASGVYIATFVGDHTSPEGGLPVSSAPGDSRQTWNFEDSKWNPLPGMTVQEMKDSEIAQDKQYLADTDWIVAKMGEASFTGQDTAALTEQYAEHLTERENARVRIRINEGRA